MFEIVIGLVILLVIAAVIFVLIGQSVVNTLKSNECTSKGGFCSDKCDYAPTNYGGCNDGKICCIKIGG